MKIIVFGATGGTGMEIVRQALEAGHQVTVFVRNPARMTLTHPNLHLAQAFDIEQVRERYRRHYASEPLVRVSDEAPWVSHIANRHDAEVGGVTLSADGRRMVVVATIDNLLKGAATQALQNLNLAFGLPETMGIPT